MHLHEIFSRIVQYGHEVTLLCSSFPSAKRVEVIDGIKVLRVGKRYNFNFCVPMVIKRLLRKKRYDVVVDDINKIPFFTPLYIKHIPILAILHHLFGRSIYRELNPILATYVRLGEKLIPLVYRNVVFSVVSESTKNELVKLGIPEKNVFIIYNGIPKELKPDPLKKSATPLILLYGRVKRYKCPEFCLYAMKKVIAHIPDVKLVVMGTGDYLPALMRLSQKLQLHEHVEFLGYVPEDEKLKVLQSSWVMVNTSSREGWGISVIEGNACGVPIIASDSPGLRDAVVHGKTGFLVKHGDIEELAQKIILILKDKQLREKLSQNALEWASQFDWERAARETLDLIEYTISKSRSN